MLNDFIKMDIKSGGYAGKTQVNVLFSAALMQYVNYDFSQRHHQILC